MSGQPPLRDGGLVSLLEISKLSMIADRQNVSIGPALPVPTKWSTGSCFCSVHPMFCQLDDIGCTDSKQRPVLPFDFVTTHYANSPATATFNLFLPL